MKKKLIIPVDQDWNTEEGRSNNTKALATVLQDALIAADKAYREAWNEASRGPIAAYRQLVDFTVKQELDHVMLLGKDWEKSLFRDEPLGTSPLKYKGGDGSIGMVHRILTPKYSMDIDTMRAGIVPCTDRPSLIGVLPTPAELGMQLAAEVRNSRVLPDRRGFYYLAPVDVYFKTEAYMVEMFACLMVVDFTQAVAGSKSFSKAARDLLIRSTEVRK